MFVFGVSLPHLLSPSPSEFVVVVYYCAAASLFNVGWASVQVSHMAMVPELSRKNSVRLLLNSARYAATIFANVLVSRLGGGCGGEECALASRQGSPYHPKSLYGVVDAPMSSARGWRRLAVLALSCHARAGNETVAHDGFQSTSMRQPTAEHLCHAGYSERDRSVMLRG